MAIIRGINGEPVEVYEDDFSDVTPSRSQDAAPAVSEPAPPPPDPYAGIKDPNELIKKIIEGKEQFEVYPQMVGEHPETMTGGVLGYASVSRKFGDFIVEPQVSGLTDDGQPIYGGYKVANETLKAEDGTPLYTQFSFDGSGNLDSYLVNYRTGSREGIVFGFDRNGNQTSADKYDNSFSGFLKEVIPVAASFLTFAFPGIGQAIGGAITGAMGVTASAGINSLIGNTIVKTALYGGDIEKAVKSSVASWAGQQVGAMAGSFAKDFIENKEGLKMVANAASSATRAAVMGDSVTDAALGSVARDSLNFAISKIPGYDKLPKDVKGIVNETVKATIAGKSFNIEDTIVNAVKDGALAYGLSQIPGFKDAPETAQRLMTTMLRTQLSGGDLSEAAINFAINEVNKDYQRAIKDAKNPAKVAAADEPEEYKQLVAAVTEPSAEAKTTAAAMMDALTDAFQQEAQVAAADEGVKLAAADVKGVTSPTATDIAAGALAGPGAGLASYLFGQKVIVGSDGNVLQAPSSLYKSPEELEQIAQENQRRRDAGLPPVPVPTGPMMPIPEVVIYDPEKNQQLVKELSQQVAASGDAGTVGGGASGDPYAGGVSSVIKTEDRSGDVGAQEALTDEQIAAVLQPTGRVEEISPARVETTQTVADVEPDAVLRENIARADSNISSDAAAQAIARTAATAAAPAAAAAQAPAQAPAARTPSLAEVIMRMVVGEIPVNQRYDLNKDGEVDVRDASYALANPDARPSDAAAPSPAPTTAPSSAPATSPSAAPVSSTTGAAAGTSGTTQAADTTGGTAGRTTTGTTTVGTTTGTTIGGTTAGTSGTATGGTTATSGVVGAPYAVGRENLADTTPGAAGVDTIVGSDGTQVTQGGDDSSVAGDGTGSIVGGTGNDSVTGTPPPPPPPPAPPPPPPPAPAPKGMSLPTLAAAPTSKPEPFTFRGLKTTEVKAPEFVSPLAAFTKMVMESRPTDYSNVYETKEQPEQREMGSFYSYGQSNDIDRILGGSEEPRAASGGLMHSALMASGGSPLSVVNFAGKQRVDYRAGSAVHGAGDGQSDDIPAMLADGEYVFDAEVVAALGNGSTKAGAQVLDKFREEIRKHKRSGSLKSIPPKSKSPLEYLAMAQKKRS